MGGNKRFFVLYTTRLKITKIAFIIRLKNKIKSDLRTDHEDLKIFLDNINEFLKNINIIYKGTVNIYNHLLCDD